MKEKKVGVNKRMKIKDKAMVENLLIGFEFFLNNHICQKKNTPNNYGFSLIFKLSTFQTNKNCNA